MTPATENNTRTNKPALAAVFLLFLLPFQLNGIYNPLIKSQQAVFWILDISIFILLPALLLWLSLRRKWISPGALALGIPTGFEARLRFLLYTALLCPALYLLYYHSYLFAGELFMTNHGVVPFSYSSLLPENRWLSLLVGLHFSLTAGIVEEVYYRGVFRQFFSSGKLQAVLYILLSSLIFSSVHWEGGIYNLFASFIVGLLLATCFWFYRYLLPLIIAHCFVDSMFYLF